MYAHAESKQLNILSYVYVNFYICIDVFEQVTNMFMLLVGIEDELINVHLGMEAPLSRKCSVCSSVTESPIRCNDCGYGTVYCTSCESNVHSRIKLHKPEIWQVT